MDELIFYKIVELWEMYISQHTEVLMISIIIKIYSPIYYFFKQIFHFLLYTVIHCYSTNYLIQPNSLEPAVIQLLYNYTDTN